MTFPLSRQRALVHALVAATLVGAGLGARPAVAQAQLTAEQVVRMAVQMDGRTPFKGTRAQKVIRQDSNYDAGAKVDFQSPDTYQIAITEPKEINGLNLLIDHNHLTCYFPRESLVFTSDLASAGNEVKDLVMGKLTDDPDLLLANYNVSLAKDAEPVALYPCYKLTLMPKRGLGANSPPGHRFWIAKENGLVMEEQRFWTTDTPDYFTSKYTELSTTQPPSIGLNVPKGVSKLRLAAGTPTNMVRYPSVEAARAAGRQIYAPTVVPQGFRLKAVDVMSIYGTDIVLLRYNDGVSNMVVTYRAKPLAFVALLAGASALNLVGKISTLSYHAPNNYAIAEKGDNLVYGYGDLYQETLQAVASSVPLPVSKPATKTGARPALAAAR